MLRLTSTSCLLLAIFILGQMVHESRSCPGDGEPCGYSSYCCEKLCCNFANVCREPRCYGKRLDSILKGWLSKH
uniref:Gsp_65 putative toxin n=1 Tax=Gemmula speciosa TaxID=439592 RepID=A0A098LXS2_GEMSP